MLSTQLSTETFCPMVIYDDDDDDYDDDKQQKIQPQWIRQHQRQTQGWPQRR